VSHPADAAVTLSLAGAWLAKRTAEIDEPDPRGRLGVLDVGSNTVHLLITVGRPGGRPVPHSSHKTELRLAEHLDPSGRLDRSGVQALVRAVDEARSLAAGAGAVELAAFATSAIRDATNSAAVLREVRTRTGVPLEVLSGADEARYTFLAVRRWFGWSSGRLLVLDIGGGSVELAAGCDELPEVALSVPLGAGRLTRNWLGSDPPRRAEVTALADHVTGLLSTAVSALAAAGRTDLAVGTSKTIRSLIRLADVVGATGRPRRTLTQSQLTELITVLRRTPSVELAQRAAINPARARQLMAGAVVARTAMRLLGLRQLTPCPWALREGVILHRLDVLPFREDLPSPRAARLG
jgi:exopolyphosphatase/guanosine-5'-triphosphate,3'-diphosphate pyrophosphatase